MKTYIKEILFWIGLATLVVSTLIIAPGDNTPTLTEFRISLGILFIGVALMIVSYNMKDPQV